MKTAMFILLAAFALASAEQGTLNPVSEATLLLGNLQTKVITEGEEAQKAYSSFAEWCEERSKNLAFEIKTAKSEMQDLQASIQEEEALSASLGSKVERLAATIATDEADLKAATTIRNKEAADFAASEKELMDVSDTLQRAIRILETEMRKGGASMMQIKNAVNAAQAMAILVQSAGLQSADAKKLTALLQNSQEAKDAEGDDNLGAPAGAIYEGHSDGIVDTLQSLLEKAEEQLDAARKQETADAHNFVMLKQSLTDALKFANQDMAKSKKSIALSGEKKSNAQGDLEVTTGDFKTDGSSLADVHHACMTRAQDFEAETKSRGEELAALAAAKQAIKDFTGGAASVSYDSAASFLQVGRSASANFESVHFVRDLARRQNDPALAQLASNMASAMRTGSSDDIFGKVKGLIADMIERLEKEADADATHKAYCDKELSESLASKEEKTGEIEKLSTRIDQMTSRSEQLKSEVAALQKALSELAASEAKMGEMRMSEKEAFAKNKVDLENGIKGAQLALKALRDYYARDDKSHSAKEGAGASIIGLIEVVESDFSKGLAEMTATEESAQAAFDQQTKDNAIERATKEQDVKYKTKEATGLDKSVAETSSDRSSVQSELDAVLEYRSSLEKDCVAKAETYGERKRRFEAELEGLKEALRILESETALIQRGGSRRALRGVHQHL